MGIDSPERLLGRWRSAPGDASLPPGARAILLEFHSDGRLDYTLELADRFQVSKLRFRLDADWLITDQPSAPREERTAFFVTSDGRLELTRDGTRAVFVREAANRSPEVRS